MKVWLPTISGMRLLVVLDLGLALVVAIEFLSIPGLERRLGMATTREPPIHDLASAPVQSAEPVREWQASIPLYKSRVWIEVPPPVAALEAPAFVMVGVFVTGLDAPVAYMKPADGGRPIRVRVGETLGGWVVESIDRKRVVVRNGAETLELAAARSSAP